MALCTAGSIPTELPVAEPVKHVIVAALLHAAGCSAQPSGCRDSGSSCAAAQAQAGMREVRRGHRIIWSHWLEKVNKESGVPDIGIPEGVKE